MFKRNNIVKLALVKFEIPSSCWCCCWTASGL